MPDLSTYALWLGYVTIACLAITILGFILKWGIRFRLVGVTSFMTVLTAGVFALGLSLFPRTEIPGAVRYSLVYDNGANQAVIAVASPITATEVKATLLQASGDLFSYGRLDLEGSQQLNVRLRTVLHPQDGVSVPLYLGEAKRSLRVRDDQQAQITVFTKELARLPKS